MAVIKLNEGKKKVNEELRNFSIVPYADEEPEDYTASSALDAIRDFKHDHHNDPHIYEIYDEDDIYYDPKTGEEIVDESVDTSSLEIYVNGSALPAYGEDVIYDDIDASEACDAVEYMYGLENKREALNMIYSGKVSKEEILKAIEFYNLKGLPSSVRSKLTRKESLEVGSTYDVFCFDCDRVTRQKYKGTTYATNEKMFVCTDCGSENYESEEIDESCRDLKEENSLKDGFEVKQVSFDVAVPVGTDLNVQAQSGNTKFYNALDKLLDSLGYQMAGDIINAEDMTDIYKANDYEPYFESES